METGPKLCRNLGWILLGHADLAGLLLRRVALTASVVKP